MLIVLHERFGLVVSDRCVDEFLIEYPGRLTIALRNVFIGIAAWFPGGRILVMRDRGPEIVSAICNDVDPNLVLMTFRIRGIVSPDDGPLSTEFFPTRADYFDPDWWLRAADWYEDRGLPVASQVRSVGQQLEAMVSMAQ